MNVSMNPALSRYSPRNQQAVKQKSNIEKPATSKKSEEMRALLRSIHRDEKDLSNPYSGGGIDVLGELQKSRSAESSKSKKQTKKYTYNPQDVSNKILRAKTSLSAAQAIRSARRKVQEVRRKLASNEENPEEIQLALSHALRMEIAAKKKKHNLEQEERVEMQQKQDERADKLEESRDSMKNAMVFAAEDEVAEAEDQVFESRDEATIAVSEAMSESGEELSEEEMAEFTEQIAEMGDELLSELEDMMDMLEDMEVLDPHMSKEELEEVKRKHRSAEEKAILKANMDYLKGMMKLSQIDKSAGTASHGSNHFSETSFLGTGQVAGVSINSALTVSSVSVDVAM